MGGKSKYWKGPTRKFGGRNFYYYGTTTNRKIAVKEGRKMTRGHGNVKHYRVVPAVIPRSRWVKHRGSSKKQYVRKGQRCYRLFAR